MKTGKIRKISEVIGQKITGWNTGLDLTLKISGGNEFTGILLGDFTISGPKSNTFHINASEKLSKPTAEMNGLVGATIADATVDEAGDLLITFSDGGKLHAPHSKEVESWEIRWLNKKQIISLPGGGFTEFG